MNGEFALLRSWGLLGQGKRVALGQDPPSAIEEVWRGFSVNNPESISLPASVGNSTRSLDGPLARSFVFDV